MTSTNAGRSPRGQGHLLRAQILDATAALMGELDDAEDVSVRAIAEAVGRTVPALYQHFTDKTDLLTAAAEHALNEMGATLDARVADITDLDRRLRMRAHAFVDFAVEHPVPYRHLFMSAPGRLGERDTIELMMSSVGFQGMVGDLTEAQWTGRMAPELDPPVGRHRVVDRGPRGGVTADQSPGSRLAGRPAGTGARSARRGIGAPLTLRRRSPAGADCRRGR